MKLLRLTPLIITVALCALGWLFVDRAPASDASWQATDTGRVGMTFKVSSAPASPASKQKKADPSPSDAPTTEAKPSPALTKTAAPTGAPAPSDSPAPTDTPTAAPTDTPTSAPTD